MSGYVLPYLLSKLFQLHFNLSLWHRCINVINTALFYMFIFNIFFVLFFDEPFLDLKVSDFCGNNRNQFNRFDSACDFAYLYTFFAWSVHCSVLFLFQFCQLLYSFTNLFICLSLHFMIFLTIYLLIFQIFEFLESWTEALEMASREKSFRLTYLAHRVWILERRYVHFICVF